MLELKYQLILGLFVRFFIFILYALANPCVIDSCFPELAQKPTFFNMFKVVVV